MILRFFAVILILGINVSTAKLFNSRAGWLKPRLGQDDERITSVPVSRCFSLRGGAKEKVSDGEKIKGVCIGIDLGTTTR